MKNFQYKNLIVKKLIGFQKRSPINFNFTVTEDKILITNIYNDKSLNLELNYEVVNDNIKSVIRDVYINLVKNYYPKLKCDELNSIFYLLKGDYYTNTIYFKNINDLETNQKDDFYLVKLKKPITIFFNRNQNLFKESINSIEKQRKLWNIFCNNIKYIEKGNDIYSLNKMED